MFPNCRSPFEGVGYWYCLQSYFTTTDTARFRPNSIERERTGVADGSCCEPKNPARNEHPRADVMIVPCEKKGYQAPRKEHARSESKQRLDDNQRQESTRFPLIDLVCLLVPLGPAFDLSQPFGLPSHFPSASAHLNSVAISRCVSLIFVQSFSPLRYQLSIGCLRSVTYNLRTRRIHPLQRYKSHPATFVIRHCSSRYLD